jgi:RNA polymerase sporulation-specific sigma factor
MFGLLQWIFRHFSAPILGISTGQSYPPPLGHAEEKALFARMKNEGDEEARATLIEHNLRLVAHIVRKYYTSYQSPDELISIGSVGLVKAIDSFKSENGARFATYGAKCIQNEILMFFRAQKKLSVEVSLSEAIDVDRDGNPLTYIDIISDDTDIPGELDRKMHVERLRRQLCTVLDEREREIICLRYGLNGAAAETQREVAKHLGISRSYVSRIEKKALDKLRCALGDCTPDFGNS